MIRWQVKELVSGDAYSDMAVYWGSNIVFNVYQLYPEIGWIRCPAFERLSYTRKLDVLDFRHLRPLSYTRKSDILDFQHLRALRYTRKSDVIDFRYVLPMSYM
jgi:hypothetical protein